MSKAGIGSTIRVTNKFDRLFFERVGVITQIVSRAQMNGPLETNYYVQADGIPCGRWFYRGDFEVIEKQTEAQV